MGEGGQVGCGSIAGEWVLDQAGVERGGSGRHASGGIGGWGGGGIWQGAVKGGAEEAVRAAAAGVACFGSPSICQVQAVSIPPLVISVSCCSSETQSAECSGSTSLSRSTAQ